MCEHAGKQQVHGWSLPPTTDTQVAVLMQSVPALVQLRILDQRDPSSKLCCAVAVTPDNSGAKTSSVWLFSGTPSCSDVTVLDPSRSNHVLDQFSLPGGARVLCAATIPPAGKTTPTNMHCNTQQPTCTVIHSNQHAL
ncbi:C-Jun-amino-terminal kinase-interacting protein 4-like isoform X1 [Acipenser oxyrinchus oxyrinchus]|uniref:C-Jun-amino-terminal kinase-interacting protein 4-like isoform X1 n=1 Tax=Acipenser oxyrinchus oxyrinchus TaxID=40147 RepID=A0AAD8CFG2_ACIOX|nr:C-Jun-amino-terminal kinase-interacting protein 4-like isoform X1 [Acipenser oxyrinchus oxyrinchus]